MTEQPHICWDFDSDDVCNDCGADRYPVETDEEGNTMTFFEMKLRAKQLSYRECLRHAKVSTDNRHKCRECFTCACAEVIREHRSHEKWTGTEEPGFIDLSVNC